MAVLLFSPMPFSPQRLSSHAFFMKKQQWGF